MADNVTVTPGTGVSVASDDIGGVQHQRVKVEWGADGVAQDVTAANPLPVSVAAKQAPTAGTIVNATSTITATDLTGIGGATISIYGTYAGVNFTVEAFDGVNWYVIAFRPASNTVNPIPILTTGIITANSALLYETTLLLGTQQLRVRALNYTSGTANVIIEPSAQFAPMFVTTNGTSTVTGSVSVSSVVPGVTPTALGKTEDTAHVTADTGVATWGVRNDTLAALTSTTGDYSPKATDIAGMVMVAGAPRLLKARQVTTITASTAETTIVTAIAATFNDLYGLFLTNTSATATEVTIRDATGAGTATPFMVPAGQTVGYTLPLDSAIPQAAVNTNWTATCATSVTSLKVTALYVKRV
jgi:hypothetical protein